ncbi:hypothetical protein [Maridesulfovibrio sp.]|uniref:DUF6874 family protein n=1 Tax=Maridesulfovibrio sp. TaxID=2795000 RepID=UPI002A187EE3|nr:hypothetical protein [Maridesulfovibrio sp.]
MLNINWHIDKETDVLVDKIIVRAFSLFEKNNMAIATTAAPMDLRLDMIATHNSACPLDLSSLLTAEDDDFLHEIKGIMFNLDRRTGRFKNGFMPYFAVKTSQGVSHG